MSFNHREKIGYPMSVQNELSKIEECAESEQQSRLGVAIAEYLLATDSKQEFDIPAWLNRHADIAEPLQAFMANQSEFHQLLCSSTNSNTTRATHAFTPTDSTSFGAERTSLSLSHSRFGPYEVLREIGRGGMGVVYAARHAQLKREVALKVLKLGHFASENDRRRLQREAESVAKLDHPAIVPVFEVGRHEGLAYLTMKLVEGGTLCDCMSPEAKQTVAEIVECMVTVTTAVQHAHERGVLHRDLKPANILVDSSGNPLVADFGLAKAFDSSETTTGNVLGTPSYMAAEQFAGECTTASDVFGLGAILYALLTKRPPLVAKSLVEHMKQLNDGAIQAPRQRNPNVPRDLDSICMNCLRSEPSLRYRSAAALAEDLTAFLENRPVRARRTSIVERAIKFARRKPYIATTVVLLPLSALGGVLAVNQISQVLQVQNLAEQQQLRNNGLATTILHARPSELPELLRDMQRDPQAAQGVSHVLRNRFTDENESLSRGQQLNLSLALLDSEPDRYRDPLYERLWESTAEQLPVITARLSTADSDFSQTCRQRLLSRRFTLASRFRAAVALAISEPAEDSWQRPADLSVVAQELVRVAPSELRLWQDLLAPVLPLLQPALETIRLDEAQPEQAKLFAVDVLCSLADAEPSRLLELLVESTPSEYAIVLARLDNHRQSAMELAEAMLLQSRPYYIEDDDLWAERQAKAAVLLLYFGREAIVWPHLKNSPTPHMRGHLIHLIPRLGVPVEPIWKSLLDEPDASIRFALMAILGSYPSTDSTLLIPDKSAIAQLVEWNRTDPDAGIHAISDWLLNRLKSPELSDGPEWPDGMLRHEVEMPLHEAEARGFRWYINSQGQTYSIVEATSFRMGSELDAHHRDQDERPHLRNINRRFAMACTEVTRESILRWQPDYDISQRGATSRPQCPIGFVHWYEAAEYCNWLSEQEGLPQAEWCYQPNAEGKYAEGMSARESFLELSGYRLPTEAEWEFACRAGTVTSRYYGDSDKLLSDYAWYSPMAGDECHEVAQRLPNDFGLFDMLGNQLEWCNGMYHAYVNLADKLEPLTLGDVGDNSVSSYEQRRVMRGGSFELTARYARAPFRSYDNLDHRILENGFRPARTLPTD